MDNATHWSSRASFIFAASAAAIGLGNIWRFPYLAGQSGGGAFVLIYLGFVLLLGIPLLIAEITLGRIGRSNPVHSMANVAKQSHQSPLWAWVGALTIATSFFILTYYVVISGWVVDYFFRAITGQLANATESTSINAFNTLKHHPWRMLLTDTLVLVGTVAIIKLGIKNGLERAIRFLFPALLILLLILLTYALTTGYFNDAVEFLFNPDWHDLTPRIVLEALGQAFFSLNIAMGVTMMFSAYLPKKSPMLSNAIFIAIADTGFALLAGLIIFPIVFANHLIPSSGPGLIFKTLPIAFGHMAYGSLIDSLFFLLLFFAAFSSVIALLEPSVAWLIRARNLSRGKAAMIAASACWLLSIGTILSFSDPHLLTLFGWSVFQIIDFVTSSVMLPIGGFFLAIFCGWFASKSLIETEMHWQSHRFWFRLWLVAMRYLAPLGIVLILLISLKII